MTLSITTFSIMTLSTKGLFATLSISDVQDNIMVLNMECCYAGCHRTECRILFIVMLSVIMLNVVMLNAVMLSVVAQVNLLQKCFMRSTPEVNLINILV